jgi:hypothetical protein
VSEYSAAAPLTPGAIAGYVSPNTLPTVAGAQNPVALPSAKQEALELRRALPRALMGGTEVMRAAGRAYAPQHPAESDASYAARINTTTLYNAFSQTVTKQAGKLFCKPVTLVDAPDIMVEFGEDVDGEGRSITAFLNDVSKEAFVDGVSFLLVEYPVIPKGATQADANAMGARPYWVLVRACQLLGWKSKNVGGEQVLMQVRFCETVDEQIDEFTTQEVDQIRVLEYGGVYRVFRKMKSAEGKEDWMLYEEGAASWQYIPMIPVYTNRTGFFEGSPPLRELAELNAEHWASSSEQRRALSFLRFAMLCVSGASTSKTAPTIEIGPDKVINLPSGGDAKYVESSGAGIASGLEDLKAIEQRMQSVGMELRIENAGQVTATQAAIDSAESNSALKAVAKGVEAAANLAMEYTAEFLGVPNPGTVKVYDEFAEQAVGLPSDFIALYGANILSRETVWDELVRRHVLDDDFDSALEAQRLTQEAMEMSALQGAALDIGSQPQDSQGGQLPDGQQPQGA